MFVRLLGVALLLASSLSAQFIGTWYGPQSPTYQCGCGPITAPWIYAHGSNHLGQNIIIRGTSRELWYQGCPWQPNTFLMTLALGWDQANLSLPAVITGYADAPILCTWDAIVGGIQASGGPEYYHMFQIPNNPAFVGQDFFAQWGMIFNDPQAGLRIMTSQGLRIVIEQ